MKGLTFASGTVEFDVDPAAMGAGLAFRAQGLEVRVVDDGVGLPAGWSPGRSKGLGLSLTRDRLAGLYGEAGRLEVRRRAERWHRSRGHAAARGRRRGRVS